VYCFSSLPRNLRWECKLFNALIVTSDPWHCCLQFIRLWLWSLYSEAITVILLIAHFPVLLIFSNSKVNRLHIILSFFSAFVTFPPHFCYLFSSVTERGPLRAIIAVWWCTFQQQQLLVAVCHRTNLGDYVLLFLITTSFIRNSSFSDQSNKTNPPNLPHMS
jgi:hypothetical protein